MSKYIMVFKTQNDWTTLPKEQIGQFMQAWGEWLGSMGSAVVDKGEAFQTGGKSVTTSGVTDSDNMLSGYTIVEAKDFDEALAYAKNSPAIQNGGSVEVYAAFGM
jgi:hypothetical protein